MNVRATTKEDVDEKRVRSKKSCIEYPWDDRQDKGKYQQKPVSSSG
jgi:hypothetical protein